MSKTYIEIEKNKKIVNEKMECRNDLTEEEIGNNLIDIGFTLAHKGKTKIKVEKNFKEFNKKLIVNLSIDSREIK